MDRRKNPKNPRYRRQKSKHGDRAFVELDGKRRYLGEYGTDSSWQQYHQLLNEWLSNGRHLRVSPRRISVIEVMARYWEHAETYYRQPDGEPTSELANIRLAMKPLKTMYGYTPAGDFGPKAPKAVRQSFVHEGCCRTYINRHFGRIKRIFKWAVAEELIPASVYQALQTVPGLKRGRSEARESEPVIPVPEAHIDAVRPHVSRQVEALIDLQIRTGARPGELVIMRPVDLDMTGATWLYQPIRHKNAYRGHQRTIYVGPESQGIIRPFLAARPVDAFLFSPVEAEVTRREQAHLERRTPASCGNAPGTNKRRRRKRPPGCNYTVDSYRRAIHRACQAAGVPLWSPHRLRHTAGTLVRKKFGVEVAQLILGHARADVTQVYAEVNHAKALEVAAKIG